MHEIILIGAGKIGSAIAKLLAYTGEYQITVVDCSLEALKRFKGIPNISTEHNPGPFYKPEIEAEKMLAWMEGKEAVIAATTYTENKFIAGCAAQAGISYFDLTEDVETTAFVRKLGDNAKPGQIFMPQCGLAPGFIGILGNDMVNRFDTIWELELRVGALPIYPTNMLKYNLTWSTLGLINEYCNPSEVILDGKRTTVAALEGLEKFSLEGVEYECFNTSGGLGTLCETMENIGKQKSHFVHNLNYKTIRYPGHRDLMSFLLNDLQFRNDKDLLAKVLDEALPTTNQDVVIVMVTGRGLKDGKHTQISDVRKIHGRMIKRTFSRDKKAKGEERFNAIQLTTAASICAVVDMHLQTPLADKGFVKQEQVDLHQFLHNRFGSYYDPAF